MANIPAKKIDFFKKRFTVEDMVDTKLSFLELYELKSLLIEFVDEELAVNHKRIKQRKEDNSYFKIQEFKPLLPSYYHELIDQIDSCESFSDFKNKFKQMAKQADSLAKASGYNGKSGISQFKDSVKRNIFITFCTRKLYHKKIFSRVHLLPRFMFYEDLLSENADIASQCREYFQFSSEMLQLEYDLESFCI